MTHKVGPKQRKRNGKERIETKCPIPPPAKGPFAKPIIRQQWKGLQWRKLGLPASALPGGEGVLLEKLGGGVRPAPKTLTLFMTKICDIPYPIYFLTFKSKPCFWPAL